MSIRPNLEALFSNLLSSVENIKAAALVDKQGLIIHSTLKKENAEFDDIIGSITSFFDNFVNRIKTDLGSTEDFYNIMTVDTRKLLFTAAGPEAILTVVADVSTNDQKLKTYALFISRKIAKLLKGEFIDTSIPISLNFLADTQLESFPSGEFMPMVVVLGNPGVGKTSLVNRFVNNEFSINYLPTIGLEISEKIISLSDECKIKFEIWDIGGQIRNVLQSRTKYYEKANLILILFDISNRSSFEYVKDWITDIKKVTSHSIPYLLIANKIDILDRKVTISEIQSACKTLNCAYFELSAKDGTNVNELFLYIAYKFLLSIQQ